MISCSSNSWPSWNLDVTFKISLVYLMSFPATEVPIITMADFDELNLVVEIGMKTMKTLQTVSISDM